MHRPQGSPESGKGIIWELLGLLLHLVITVWTSWRWSFPIGKAGTSRARLFEHCVVLVTELMLCKFE